MVKVNLPKVEQETRDRLDKFKAEHNLKNQNNRLATAGDTIDFLIQSVEFYQSMVSEEDIKKYLEKQGVDFGENK